MNQTGSAANPANSGGPPSDLRAKAPPKTASKAASASRPAPALTTHRLGRWTLLKPLARGGMGEVYLGCSGGIEGAERPCVVKIVRREHAQDPSFLARFFDEARIQAQLQHPGVAQVLEASIDQSAQPYVVLEYVEGKNLSDVRQRCSQLKAPMSWADAVAIVVALAEALVHVHERTDASGRALGIVHRDVSPQNVMLGYAGDIKLIDFGTARGENRRSQTVSGIVFAKPGYVAPEVANQQQPGPQADLYALGIILWELIMGRRFLTGDPAEHLALVAEGHRPVPPLTSAVNVPLTLDAIVARLTAMDLRDRYATAREALADLAKVLSRAPSLADGERSVRGRIAHLMSRLYPTEPARSRAEFARLLHEHRKHQRPAPTVPESPAPANVKDLLPGTRYQLKRQIAASLMSVVYEAVHVDLERRVALKVLPKEHCDNPRFEAQFRSEARALAQLRHEHLVTLHDFGVSQDGRPYYAMELLEGQSLKELATGQTLPWRQALDIAIAVCRALDVVHRAGMVHRDIKPGNLFIQTDNTVKLIDFGIARGVDPEEPSEDDSSALRVTGTLEYMAPEQIGRQPLDGRADIYGLGAVLYQLLTGHLPHQEPNTVLLLEQKKSVAPLAPRKLVPHLKLPAQLDWVLLKALAADPEQRFDNATQFERALELARSAPERLRRTRRASLTAAGLVGLAGVLAAAYPFEAQQAQEADAADVFDAVPEGTYADLRAPGPSDEPIVASSEAPERSTPPHAANAPTPTAASTDEVGEAQAGEGQPEDEVAPSEDETVSAGAPPAEDDEDPTIRALDAALPEQVEARIALADDRSVRDRRARQAALEIYRQIGEQYPEHPRVLSGWSKVAGRAKWWGESLRVAIRWAALDPRPEAQLHLARTQRLVGQRYGAVQTLERLLQRFPEHAEASAMLQRYRQR